MKPDNSLIDRVIKIHVLLMLCIIFLLVVI